MPLAFWRRKSNTVKSAREQAQARTASVDEESGPIEPAAAVRIRARRRLIGAAALLLMVAIVVPMLLDSQPTPVPDNIAIDIPSEKTPFTPRLPLPPVPSPDNVPVAPPPDVAPIPAPVPAPFPEKADEPPVKAVDSKKVDEQRARALLDGKANAKPNVASAKAARFAVQAAAPASETAARDLADRLKKAGFASYTERVDTKQGARYRVRLGPYASRDEADGVRDRLKAQGIGANLITL